MGNSFQKEYRKKRKQKQAQQHQTVPVPSIGGAAPQSSVAISTETIPQSTSASTPPPPPACSLPLDLLRAKDALGKIDLLKARTDYGNFVSYVEGLPATILQNGLGQALATLLAGAKLAEPDNRNNDEKARETLYSQLSGWLCRNDPEAPYRGLGDLMQAITQGDEDAYLRAQAEALAYLRWFKKFTVAFLKKLEDG